MWLHQQLYNLCGQSISSVTHRRVVDNSTARAAVCRANQNLPELGTCMPERALRFGVAGPIGFRAETWKCWTVHGKGKRDVYLACRALSGQLKLSLHQSGKWHVAFDSQRFDQLFEEGAAPPDRFLGKWEQPEGNDGLTLACRIYVPSHAANIPDEKLDENVQWIAHAPPGQSVEIVIFLWNHAALAVEDWPGKSVMKTALLGTVPLDGGGSVIVVHRTCESLPQPPVTRAPRYFRGMTESDMLGANRAVVWGDCDDGSVVFQEFSVTISRPM
jgi:hypothetical protein